MRHEKTIQEPRVRYLSAYPTGRELGEKWRSEGVWSVGVESGGVREL